MNSKTPTPFSDTDSVDDSNQAASKDILVNDRLARRRLLLSTVTGSAVLLSASPIKALAGTCATQQCSISGMKSANHSFKPGECEELCGGYSPGWWRQNWNQNDQEPSRPWPASPDTKVKQVLPYTHLPANLSLFELMGNPKYSKKDERHWICAWLNALAYPAGMGPAGHKFPYTADQVRAFYLGTGQYSSSDALVFFTTYMEGVRD